MIVNYICLIMVQSKYSRVNLEIQSFLAAFSFFLYIPIFTTSAEYLVYPTLFYFIRFCAIVELSFVLVTVCVIGAVNYQFRKNHLAKEQDDEISDY